LLEGETTSGPLVLHAEAMAALGPAAVYDGPAAAGAHTDQKAVGAFPSDIVRLKGSFHLASL